MYSGLKKDPTGFGKNQLLDFVKGIVFPFLFMGAGILVLFGILGVTDWFSVGPFGFFKFLFIVGLIFYIFWVFVLYYLYKYLKKLVDKTKNIVDQNVNFDHDVTPEK